MQVVHNTESVAGNPPIIFLAGPTPRRHDVSSWRPEAIALLENIGFTGAVVVPEDRGFIGKADFEYAGQVEWERHHIARATVVVFWVPRHLQDMPAFTTNIEFGIVSERGQAYVLGFPKEAPKMRYLEYVANKQGAPVCHDLRQTLESAVTICQAKPQVP